MSTLCVEFSASEMASIVNDMCRDKETPTDAITRIIKSELKNIELRKLLRNHSE